MADFASLSDQIDKERRSVSFDAYDITVRQLLDMVGSHDLEIAPEYQRKFVWDEERESKLIESIFLGIPVPSLFMATNADGTWEVVDGVQRLSTLLHFGGDDKALATIGRANSLTLQKLEKLTELNGMRFVELPRSLQLQFQLRPIRVTTLNDKSDLDVRYELFERLNTGGVLLHPQEIRNCIFRGPLRDQLKELSEYESFKTVVRLQENEQTSALYEECILRFFAFQSRYKSFDHLVDQFLTNYAKETNLKGVPKKQVDIFKKTMDFLKDELPNGIVRGRTTTPIVLFEAVAVGTALAFDAVPSPKKNVVAGLLDDAELRKFTQGGTNTRAKVTGRIEYVRDKLV
jgi:hypothetical protein